jgi:TonB family protein
MSIRIWVLAVGLATAVPGVAQAPDANARNRVNWETLFKHYPPRALAAREQGMVRFAVKLDNQGHPTECLVTQSSGFPLLDEETCRLITLHAMFKPPVAMSHSQASTFQGAINWQLPRVAAATPAATVKPAKAAEAPKKTICRRIAATGSNVRSERVCMSARDWDRASEEVRKDWDELQGRKGSTNGG